jgi:hypothetical protein
VDVFLLLLMVLGIMVVGIWLILDYEARCTQYLTTTPMVAALPTRRWSRRDLDEGVRLYGTLAHHFVMPECMVCLEDFVEGDVVMTLLCEHDFHKACV